MQKWQDIHEYVAYNTSTDGQGSVNTMFSVSLIAVT